MLTASVQPLKGLSEDLIFPPGIFPQDVFLPKCQLHAPNRRDSSPTLIMEVVEDNDDRPEEEENNRVVTVAAASSLNCGNDEYKKIMDFSRLFRAATTWF